MGLFLWYTKTRYDSKMKRMVVVDFGNNQLRNINKMDKSFECTC